MLYSIKDREDLENLEELVSLQDQVKVVKLQDKLGKQNFHEDMKKVFEPVTKAFKNTSQDITKTITETSVKNNQAIENINNKLLEIMNDRGILASYLMTPLSKITNPENTSQFKLVQDHNSNRVNDLLMKNKIPITFNGNILTFRDTGKEFELTGDLLEMTTNSNYNFNLASLADRKLMYYFAKEKNFDLKAQSKKSTRDRTLIKLLKSPAIMAAGVITIFLSENPDKLCNRLKLFLQEKHAGINSDIVNQEIVAIVDKLLEYKCTSKEKHKQILIKCNLLQYMLLYHYMYLNIIVCVKVIYLYK